MANSTTQKMQESGREIYALTSDIRYVALYRGGELVTSQKDGLSAASDAGSDQYEELLVNPTLLKLVQQRGNIDCGGAGFVIVGYGNFLQLVIALDDGHVSVCFEKSANPIGFVDPIRAICQ